MPGSGGEKGPEPNKPPRERLEKLVVGRTVPSGHTTAGAGVGLGQAGFSVVG